MMMLISYGMGTSGRRCDASTRQDHPSESEIANVILAIGRGVNLYTKLT